MENMSEKCGGKVSVREKICYAMGDASANIAWRGVAAFLFIVYTDVFGLNPAAVGTLMLVARLGDGVSDVLMGVVADRTRTRWGKYRPWMLWSALPLGVTLSMMFTCPESLSMTGRLVYAYVTYIVFTLVYTAQGIPYGALLSVMSPDDRERTSIGSYKMVGAFAGGMLVQGLLLVLKERFDYAVEHKDELVYYAHRDGIRTAATVSDELIPELERVLHRDPGSVSLSEIVGALKKIGVDAVFHTAEAEDAARAQAEALLDGKLERGKPVILTNSFSGKAFLEKTFPEKKDSFLFYDSALAVFGKAADGYDKRFAFGPVCGDAMECEKTHCVDIAVNARELARIMIRTGAEPNAGRTANPETLGLHGSAGRYERLLGKTGWNMDKEPESFEENGLRCAICHNLGQARKAMAETDRYDVIRIIA